MASGRGRWSDAYVEALIGRLLRAGVLAAAGVVLAGAAIYLATHGTERADLRVFHGEPSEFTTVLGVLEAVRSLRGRGLIQLGLLLLIATPVARVALSLLGFLRQRDWTYVLVTLFVLALLLSSLAVGGGY